MMKFWFAFPLALLMLSPLVLDRWESRMDGIAEGGAAFPPSYAEGGAAFPPE